jgi:hypothetical protein
MAGCLNRLYPVLRRDITMMSSKKQLRFVKVFFRTTLLSTGISVPVVVATAVSLRWNGYKLQFLDRAMYDWLMSLYQTGSVNKRTLDAWLRAHAAEV